MEWSITETKPKNLETLDFNISEKDICSVKNLSEEEVQALLFPDSLIIYSAIITGWLGILFAINSMLDGNEMGAGINLVAAALAFGFSINRSAS